MSQPEVDRVNEWHRRADLMVRGQDPGWDDDEPDWREVAVGGAVAGAVVLALVALFVTLLADQKRNRRTGRRR